MIAWYKNWKLKREIRKDQIDLLAKEVLDEIINTPDFISYSSWNQFYYKDGVFYHSYMVCTDGGGGYQTKTLSIEKVIEVCYSSAKSRLKKSEKNKIEKNKIDKQKLKNKTMIELIQLKGGLKD